MLHVLQATLSPPVSGKMFKGLCIWYIVVVSTFFSVAVSGYWAFGNRLTGNIFNNFAPSGEPSLVPNWLLFTANIFVLLQLFAVALVYNILSINFACLIKFQWQKRDMFSHVLWPCFRYIHSPHLKFWRENLEMRAMEGFLYAIWYQDCFYAQST